MYRRIITLFLIVCAVLAFNTQVFAENNSMKSTNGIIIDYYTNEPEASREILLLSDVSESIAEGEDDGEESESSSTVSSSSETEPSEEGTAEDSSSSNFMYSIIASVMAGMVLLIIFLLRKRIARLFSRSHSRDDDEFEETGESFRLTGSGISLVGQSFTIKSNVLIGRDPNRCNILFPNEAQGVSSLHCEVIVKENCVVLIDKGSTYGTFLADKTKLVPNTQYPLNVGDSFYLGTKANSFRIDQ